MGLSHYSRLAVSKYLNPVTQSWRVFKIDTLDDDCAICHVDLRLLDENMTLMTSSTLMQ